MAEPAFAFAPDDVHEPDTIDVTSGARGAPPRRPGGTASLPTPVIELGPSGSDVGPQLVVPGGEGRLRRWALPPALCFAASQALLWWAAASARASFWSTGALVRWDAIQYLDIAKHWYYVIGCPSVGYPPGSVCGNAGWFPAYPLLIAGLHLLGAPPVLSAVALAAGFQLAVLVVVWTSLGAQVTARNLIALVCAGAFLDEVYLRAAFPISMCVLFLLLTLVMFSRRRWGAASVCGAIAASSYPTAVFLAPAIVVWALLQGRDLLRPALVVAVVTMAGFASVLVVQEVQTGHWDAFFQVQQKYGNGIHEPVSAFVRSLAPPPPPKCAPTQTCRYLYNGGGRHLAARIETVVAAILVLSIVVAGVRQWGSWTALDRGVVPFSVLFFIVPLITGGVGLSRYRADALLLPASVVTRHLPLAWQLALVASAVGLDVAIARLFFAGALI